MDLAGESRPTQIQFVIKRRSPMPSGKSALNREGRRGRFYHVNAINVYQGMRGPVLKSFPVVSVQDLEPYMFTQPPT